MLASAIVLPSSAVPKAGTCPSPSPNVGTYACPAGVNDGVDCVGAPPVCSLTTDPPLAISCAL